MLQLLEPARLPAAIHPRLGLGGGGQLAQMTALAGLRQPLETDRRPSSAETLLGLGGSEVWQRFFS